MRTIWWLSPLLLLQLLLGGCALPAAVVLASYAADGVSYLTTGKSVTDHGLSAATGHDCALLRPILKEKPVCDTSGTAKGRDVPVEIGKNVVQRPNAAFVAAQPPRAGSPGTISSQAFLSVPQLSPSPSN